jgi:hypothetical protein
MQSVTEQLSPASGLLASPALTTAKSTPRRAIPDEARAKLVVSELLQANRRRQQVFARILSKLNAERPYDQAALVDEGLGWKHNFSTKPLAAIIDRVSPRFVDVINLAKYLTNSSLPPKYADSTRKTEIFRDKFTKLVRSRPEWRGLLDVLALDDALFGCTVAGWLDEGSWFPDHFRFDHLYLPDGTKQHAKAAQVVCVREDYLVHELYEKIQDPEAAKTAGWDLEATRDVSTPPRRRTCARP